MRANQNTPLQRPLREIPNPFQHMTPFRPSKRAFSAFSDSMDLSNCGTIRPDAKRFRAGASTSSQASDQPSVHDLVSRAPEPAHDPTIQSDYKTTQLHTSPSELKHPANLFAPGLQVRESVCAAQVELQHPSSSGGPHSWLSSGRRESGRGC